MYKYARLMCTLSLSPLALPIDDADNTMVDTRIGLYAAPVSLGLFLLHHCWRWFRQPKTRYPPSPTSLPFVGNLFSIPAGPEYLAFVKLGAELESDIVFLNILGQKLVILNSAEAASEILEKRSAYYSDRPQIPMVTDPELMNWSGLVTIIGYNDLWRHYRRMMNNWLNTRIAAQFNDLQEQQARLLLQRIWSATKHTQPFEYVKKEFFFSMGSSMLQLAYGYKPRDPQDPFFKEALLAFHNVMLAGMQTNFLVNTFPVLLYIPGWLPGAGWKRIGRDWGAQQYKAKTEPYEWVKRQIASGTHQSSLIGSLLQDHKLLRGLSSTQGEERLKEIGIVLFGGGTDTSANFLVSFVAAMVSNPNVQEKAQQELDSVLGPAVLPTISDKERLPYITNLINEVFRLFPVAPLAIPHACFQDDIYKGYVIQKGTIVLGNICKCPGIHFAEASVFINVALLLATFTFSKKRNNNGQEVMPRIEAERNSIMFELKPFDFEFKPRSEAHTQLILGAVDE
ncbi:unnamed protein product [Rhizoctonia solani]|uniref:O-methylsterigmatocystin oxidoreductase n=1 Tax=Rhizoctonia solani TaxID=456999 RepID=A0A8H3H2J8_9AGAM|nr:unnamed protein product [Rhizoctonia solani]